MLRKITIAEPFGDSVNMGGIMEEKSVMPPMNAGEIEEVSAPPAHLPDGQCTAIIEADGLLSSAIRRKTSFIHKMPFDFGWKGSYTICFSKSQQI